MTEPDRHPSTSEAQGVRQYCTVLYSDTPFRKPPYVLLCQSKPPLTARLPLSEACSVCMWGSFAKTTGKGQEQSPPDVSKDVQCTHAQ